MPRNELTQQEIEKLLGGENQPSRKVTDDELESIKNEFEKLIEKHPAAKELLKMQKCIAKDHITIVNETAAQTDFNICIPADNLSSLQDTFAVSLFKN